MKRALILGSAMLATFASIPSFAAGQTSHDVTLHLSSRWKQCSFQIDPALTQEAWHQVTREAGVVTYFRPLLDARPMGKGTLEVSVVQSQTGIDDADAAWNDTFVHPREDHWLFEGSRLVFPGLTMRAGLTDRIDASVYATKSIGANYGFYGGQVQYNLARDRQQDTWAASARLSAVSMYGPEDMDFSVFGADLLASRSFALARWASVSPYAGGSAFLSRSHEKTAAVSLDDERVVGLQGMAGAVLRISKARIAMEYDLASVTSVSMKVGVAF
jgi:hypothetical protein